MLDAIVAGEGDPQRPSWRSPSVRKNMPLLRAALRRRFSEHHVLIVGLALDEIRHLETGIGSTPGSTR